MKKTAAILSAIVILCLLAALTITAAGGELNTTDTEGEVVIDVTVPKKHKISLSAGDDIDIEIIEGGSVTTQTGEDGETIEIDRLTPIKIKITPDEDKVISKILVDGEDITDKYEDGILTLDPTNKDITLTIETKDDTSVPTTTPVNPTDTNVPDENDTSVMQWIIPATLLILACIGGFIIFYLKKRKKGTENNG